MFRDTITQKSLFLASLLTLSMILLVCCTESTDIVKNINNGDTQIKQNLQDSDTPSENPTNIENLATGLDISDRTNETHSNDAEPDFDEVFEDDTVKRLDIVISPDDRQAMIDDLTDLYGDQGNSSGNRGPGPGIQGGAGVRPERQQNETPPAGVRVEGGEQGVPPESRNQEEGFARSERANQELRGGTGGGDASNFASQDPIYVAASVVYNETERYKVGVRFKGNSSLRSSRSTGNGKLSFKLNFDKYEDEFPELKNQRFYGFEKLSLKNNYNDASQIREKVAGDVFLDAGLAGSHTAFYELYVDHGNGPEYFGVYTLVEEVDDTVIKTQFADDSGNLYKPDGAAATFASNTYNEDQYVKKTNEDEADYSDIKNLLSVLHDEKRITNPASWRVDLDAIFDTDVFLKYLAVNNTIQNRDTYGRMTHNYFIYNNPETSKLTWIPWDNNEALQTGKGGGSLALDLSNLTNSERPIIEYMYNDEIYKAKYDAYLQEVIDGPFAVEKMQDIYSKYEALLAPYVSAERDGYTFLRAPGDFATAIERLKTHVESRAESVKNYLEG